MSVKKIHLFPSEESYVTNSGSVEADDLALVPLNLSFNNLSDKPKAYVTKTWHSGTSWYRVWSDGFIEQGGRVNAVAYDSKTKYVTFMIPMSSTNYFAVSNPLDSMHSTGDLSSRVSLLTLDGMTVKGSINSNREYTDVCTWYVCGY